MGSLYIELEFPQLLSLRISFFSPSSQAWAAATVMKKHSDFTGGHKTESSLQK
jgi:hypothetical protein